MNLYRNLFFERAEYARKQKMTTESVTQATMLPTSSHFLISTRPLPLSLLINNLHVQNQTLTSACGFHTRSLLKMPSLSSLFGR